MSFACHLSIDRPSVRTCFVFVGKERKKGKKKREKAKGRKNRRTFASISTSPHFSSLPTPIGGKKKEGRKEKKGRGGLAHPLGVAPSLSLTVYAVKKKERGGGREGGRKGEKKGAGKHVYPGTKADLKEGDLICTRFLLKERKKKKGKNRKRGGGGGATKERSKTIPT